jgi:hypothetical protein
MDMGVPNFGYAVRFHSWYKNFISGLRSCENQYQFSWLIVKLLSLLWVKNYSGLVGNLLFMAYSIPLNCYVIFYG